MNITSSKQPLLRVMLVFFCSLLLACSLCATACAAGNCDPLVVGKNDSICSHPDFVLTAPFIQNCY